MRRIYLSICGICIVIMLIIFFQNAMMSGQMIYLFYSPIPMTTAFLIIALLNLSIGVFSTLFVKRIYEDQNKQFQDDMDF